MVSVLTITPLLLSCFQPQGNSIGIIFPQDSSWFGNRTTSEERNQATKVLESGMHYMRCYAKLASKAHALHRPLWVYKPQIHYFHHILLQIKDELYRGAKPYNVLAFSCAMAEDFIGRASLLSRRVNARTTHQRVLQRYLAGAFDVWQHHDAAPQG